jgi:hypothetical protein
MKNTETSPKSPAKPKRTPRPDVVPPDRGVVDERAFLKGARSDDPVVEEMGEETVRAMTSGEDETRTQRGDEAAPDLEAQIDGSTELQDDDLEDIAAGDPLRSSPPKRL